jgi:hypothetical protein
VLPEESREDMDKTYESTQAVANPAHVHFEQIRRREVALDSALQTYKARIHVGGVHEQIIVSAANYYLKFLNEGDA